MRRFNICLALVLFWLQLSGVITVKNVFGSYLDEFDITSTRMVSMTDETDLQQNYRLTVWDISDLNNAKSGHYFWDIELVHFQVVDTLLYYSTSNHLYIYSITDILHPIELGGIYLQTNTWFLIRDNYIFFGNFNQGLIVYDLSDPVNPVYVTNIPISGTVWRIWSVGEYIAVINGSYTQTSLELLSFDNSTHEFTEHASFNFANRIQNVGLLSNLLFIKQQDSLFTLYDISDPDVPVNINYEPQNLNFKTAVPDGNRLYTTNSTSHFQVWELDSQNEMQLLGSYSFVPYTYTEYKVLMVKDGYPYVLGYSGTISLMNTIDFSPPDNLISEISLPYDVRFAEYLHKEGDYILYATDSGLGSASIAQDGNLIQNNFNPDFGILKDFLLNDNLIVCRSTQNNFQYISIGNLDNPQQPYLLKQTVFRWDKVFRIYDDKLYVSTNQAYSTSQIKIYGITTNTQEIPCLGQLYYGNGGSNSWSDYLEYQGYRIGLGGPYQLVFFGEHGNQYYQYGINGYTYLNGYGGYLLLNNGRTNLFRLNLIGAPTFVSTFDYGIGWNEPRVRPLFYNDHYLITVHNGCNTINITDIADPLNPVLVKSINLPYPTFSTSLWNDRLVTANGLDGIHVLDISLAPTPVEDNIQPVMHLTTYPNPFTSSLSISFSLDKSSEVNASVYNSKGQLINTFYSGTLEKGTRNLSWSGNDTLGKACANGVYIIKIKTASGITSQKVLKIN